MLLLILVWVRTPLFSVADKIWHKESARTSTIDGLRGFLAISVFFHHAALYYHYLLTGSWQLPPSVFYTQSGQASVSLFFMITGFLFWGKAIRAHGRLPWKNLYIGRIFRIGPLYYLATLIMLLIVFRATGFALHESSMRLLAEIYRLAFFGFYNPAPIINTYQNPGTILAGVTWTLRYEWLFYLLMLPIAAFFARPRGGHIWFSILGLAICLALIFKSAGTTKIALADFFAGMACASIQQNEYLRNLSIGNGSKSLWVIALLTLLMTQFQTAYAAIPIMLLGLVFLLISTGCSVFGIMNTRTARRLGEISYGIYILQGLALYAAFYFAPVRVFALSSVSHYWLVIALAGLGLVSAALAAHVLVEMPGINAGKAIIKRLSKHNATPITVQQSAD